MMELDYPTIVSSFLVIAGSVGGLGYMKFKKDVFGFVIDLADFLLDMSDLVKTIADAGSDDNLSPEEWTKISNKALELKEDLARMESKLAPLVNR